MAKENDRTNGKLVEVGRKITGMIAAVNHVASFVFITLPGKNLMPAGDN